MSTVLNCISIWSILLEVCLWNFFSLHNLHQFLLVKESGLTMTKERTFSLSDPLLFTQQYLDIQIANVYFFFKKSFRQCLHLIEAKYSMHSHSMHGILGFPKSALVFEIHVGLIRNGFGEVEAGGRRQGWEGRDNARKNVQEGGTSHG